MSADTAAQDGAAARPLPARWPASRTVWLALAWAYAAGLAGWLIAARELPGTQLGDLLRLPVLAGPALAAFAAGRLRSGRDRHGWYQVGLAWLLSAAACLVWLLTTGQEASWLHRFASNVLYNAYYPFMMAGLLLLARFPRGSGPRLRLLVDALVVVVATQALAWYFLLRNYGPGEVLPNFGDVLANQVGETLVLLCAALTLHRPIVGGAEPGLRLLALGAFAATVADLTSIGASLTSSVPQAVASEVALIASAALITTAALLPGRPRRLLGISADILVRLVLHLPYLAVLVVAALLVGELPTIRPAGSPVPVLALALIVLSGLAILRAVIAQRDAEAEAAARAVQDERLRQGRKLEVMGELAAAVSHDLANLLTAMGGSVAALQERAPHAPEIGEIEHLVRRGTELCRGLLRFSRRTPSQAAADLCGVAEAVAPLLRRLLPPGFTLSLEGAPGVAQAVADPAQLEIALVNLVVNARDAMPGGGEVVVVVDAPELAERGRNGQERRRRWARLSVRDGGVGMDEATLARCVEPFFTTKPAGRGTGLGLATVNGIALGAGGRLAIESSPGKGTQVSLLLPLAGDPDAGTRTPVPR
jgi:signal transduction histidine kinase